jgi:hypothetical protein
MHGTCKAALGRKARASSSNPARVDPRPTEAEAAIKGESLVTARTHRCPASYAALIK